MELKSEIGLILIIIYGDKFNVFVFNYIIENVACNSILKLNKNKAKTMTHVWMNLCNKHHQSEHSIYPYKKLELWREKSNKRNEKECIVYDNK